MKTSKEKIHIVAPIFINPQNPVSVNLIGAGGTGSQVLTALARINFALTELNHAGILVNVFDPDSVEQANLGRQLFSRHEIGMNKAISLTNRINRFFGTNWKGIAESFETLQVKEIPGNRSASLTISCVDTVSARKEIGAILSVLSKNQYQRDCPLYWMDFGNTKDSGQVLLCSLKDIPQPVSRQYQPVALLPPFMDQFGANELSDQEEPSCSLAQALGRQDLFINSSLANLGASLIWSMFREGIIRNRGLFLNLADFRTQPIRL